MADVSSYSYLMNCELCLYKEQHLKRYPKLQLLNDLPSIWTADDTKLLQNRYCDLWSFLVWICRSCVKVCGAS